MSTLHSGPSNLHTHQAGHVGEKAHAVLMHQNSKNLPVTDPISNATSAPCGCGYISLHNASSVLMLEKNELQAQLCISWRMGQ